MIGERLGPYRIDRKLGSGGMGTVYAATASEAIGDVASDETVALKVIHPHLIAERGYFKRFLREAEIGRSVVHENVVRTFDLDSIGGAHFLVMEYVDGQTLHALQVELERLPEQLCLHAGLEIARGLAAMHEAGVVHRDLKPANVLITKAHVVKVMDLGVARLVDEQMRLSHTGAFVGSVEYAAPEQFGGQVDHRCDLHALGVLLYELACGRHPFRGGEFRAVMMQICKEQPRRVGEVNPQISPFFEEVVHRLLEKDPDDRFPTAEGLAAVLEEGENSSWWRERVRVLRATTSRPLRRLRVPRETAVYGRETEITRLRESFGRARDGEGQVVLIEGEAGIGKSRLVDEAIQRLRADGEDLDFLFGSYPPSGAATAAGAFSAAYREHLGDGGSTEALVDTPLLAPAFDALLRGDAPPTGVEPLTKDSLQTCFVNVTRRLASERTTVVLIDDLHFAPDEGRALFTALATAVPGHRVLLIGTLRPGSSEQWLAHLTRYEHVAPLVLDRLGPKDLALLLDDSFHSKHLAQQLSHQVALKSDGNPFFVFEIIRGLREGHYIEQSSDGTWISTGEIEKIQIPSSVLDLVNARVAGLDDDDRHLLDVAACLGYEFDASLVGDSLGLGRLPVLQRFAKIEKRDRLVRSSGRLFAFDHHQVQEALYVALPEMLREEYHAAIADALATRAGAAEEDVERLDGALCLTLCEQYLRGARGADAMRYLDAAQSHLENAYLHAEIVGLTERALVVPGLLSGARRARALLRLGGTLDLMGRRSRQEEVVLEAVRLAEAAGDHVLHGQALKALGILYWRTSRHTEAERALREALEVARSADDREGEAAARGNLGNVLESLNRRAEAREELERQIEFSRASGDRRSEAMGLGNLGTAFYLEGHLREAREHFERHLEIAREIGHRRGEAIATGNLGLVLKAEGRLRDARAAYERQLTLCREIGHREGEARANGSLGNLARVEGRLTEARDYLERSLALRREIGDRAGEAVTTGNLGAVLAAEGRLIEALETQERSRTLSVEAGSVWGETFALGSLGSIHLALGDLERAREAIHASLARCVEIGARSVEGQTVLALAALADAEDLGVEALDATERALALLRESGHASGIADSLIELGDRRRRAGNVEGAREALEEAVALTEEQHREPQRLLALAVLACLPLGDATAAEEALVNLGDGGDSARVRNLLWQATDRRDHLFEAKRLLDEAVERVPEERRGAMLRNVVVNREIFAAWNAAKRDHR